MTQAPDISQGPGALVESLLQILQQRLAGPADPPGQTGYVAMLNDSKRMKRYGLVNDAPQPKEVQANDIPDLPIQSYPAVRVTLQTFNQVATGSLGFAEGDTRLIVRLYVHNNQKMPGGSDLACKDVGTALFFKTEALAWAIIQALIENLPGWKVDGVNAGGYKIGPPSINWKGARQVESLTGVVQQVDLLWTMKQDTRHLYGGPVL